ncbi:MAG: hypothetical protein FVQ78_07355 [Solirubrobacterales bacterium]|nr:hypothetical protein [Solirubrobacterales bacterium]
MGHENNIININPPTQEARRLWAKALELAEAFGAQERWSLVGGLMVQLHAFEHGSGSRPTVDIDVLGDSRRRPPMTERIAEVLVERGGEMAMPPVSDEDLGYKFEIDGEVIEVLGSEGVRRDPKTLGKHTTFQVPGGTQALARTEVVRVSLDGGPAVDLRRPSLLGAILIKARVVAKQRDKFESDRQDLIRLLGFVENPRALAEAEELRTSEKRWLRNIDPLLGFDDTALADLFPGGEVPLAEQAYRLLIA